MIHVEWFPVSIFYDLLITGRGLKQKKTQDRVEFHNLKVWRFNVKSLLQKNELYFRKILPIKPWYHETKWSNERWVNNLSEETSQLICTHGNIYFMKLSLMKQSAWFTVSNQHSTCLSTKGETIGLLETPNLAVC